MKKILVPDEITPEYLTARLNVFLGETASMFNDRTKSVAAHWAEKALKEELRCWAYGGEINKLQQRVGRQRAEMRKMQQRNKELEQKLDIATEVVYSRGKAHGKILKDLHDQIEEQKGWIKALTSTLMKERAEKDAQIEEMQQELDSYRAKLIREAMDEPGESVV